MLKVIAFYLPQFHSIPENDEVWGKGFTEWDNVRAATAMVDGQNQPRIPEDDNYYNLLDEDTIQWQTEIASSHNIYGFCFYHYWFSGKKILNKPLELIRDSKKIHFPYSICWANESWANAWESDKPKTFLEQKYGSLDEWAEHFNYLLTFFKDPDYIVENNKPFLTIYRPENIPNLNEKLDFWDKLAKENGFDGICYSYQQIDFELDPNSDDSRFKYSIEYQPKYALVDYEKAHPLSFKQKSVLNLKIFLRNVASKIEKIIKIDILKINRKFNNNKKPRIFNYSEIADVLTSKKASSEKSIGGMFVGYDDTPRKQERGMIIQSTPEEFSKYLEKQVLNIKNNYETDYLFLFAWNEWAEGGYLEPDSKYGLKYLESVKKAVDLY